MVLTYDVGSLPFKGDQEKFSKGASLLSSILPLLFKEGQPEPLRYFEDVVLRGILDKLRAGIDVANYPQFRDMALMFLDPVQGLEKTNQGYLERGKLAVKSEEASIPEVEVIRRNVKRLYQEVGKKVRLKVCITGPYTLSSFFLQRDPELFKRLGDVLSIFVSKSIFKDKYGGVELLALDEPTFGFMNDPLIDYGSEGREHLRAAWDDIFYRAASKGIDTILHLHNTSDQLFWEPKNLKVVESHVDDPLYRSEKTKELLEHKDKFLKVSVCITDFQTLIERKLKPQVKIESDLHSLIGDVWARVIRGRVNAMDFLEDEMVLKDRLVDAQKRYGEERVLYAGPECGLRSFPTYECAIECLRRVSKAVSYRP